MKSALCAYIHSFFKMVTSYNQIHILFTLTKYLHFLIAHYVITSDNTSENESTVSQKKKIKINTLDHPNNLMKQS